VAVDRLLAPSAARTRLTSKLKQTALLLGAIVALHPHGARAAEPSWQLEQPAPPPGVAFKLPLGPPGDLQFIAPNRGLLAVEGNAAIPRGLFTYDGVEWHQLSTVCGSTGDSARVAFAGPREFWTISEPSKPRSGAGTALCRFKDGQVVGSFSTALEDPDPYRPMASATCNGPNDCWFGGFGTQDLTGARVGAFHLHWNGSVLETVYAPQGRGVSDLETHNGTVFESVVVGRRPGDPNSSIDLAEPETPKPRLLHRVVNGRFENELFMPADRVAVPSDALELLGLDSDGEALWAVGGGAASGPSAPEGDAFATAPLVVLYDGTAWREVPLDPSLFSPGERLSDVASVPGSEMAWAVVQPFLGARSVNAPAKVALIGPDGSAALTTLPPTGAGRGTGAKIAFTGPNDGWLVTYAGWLFHYTNGSRPPRDGDPAYQGTITFRPNEATEQFVPDRPPVDDSELFRPPPLEIEQPPPPAAVKRLPALLKRVKSSRRGRSLIVRFQLARRARVALIALRRGKTVARTRARMLNPGRHTLRLRLQRKKWPQRLRFSIREPGVPINEGGGDTGPTGDGDVLTTRKIPRKVPRHDPFPLPPGGFPGVLR
jgi:hypothetical protein